jgi:hypothetical protein
MTLTLGQIKTNFNGFHRIIELNTQIAEDGEINISNWVDGNMCALLGAIFYRKKTKNMTIHISGISSEVKEILQKNHFLSLFDLSEKPDSYGTTIEYRQFKIGSNVYEQFLKYVIKYFRSRRMGLPRMTPALLKRFRGSLFEIFSNSLEDSYTQDAIFACGQFFPQRKRLHFTIADLGIGIDGNIRKKLQKQLSAENAIKWAISGKTTRRDRSGGLGLQLIREFIELNQGRLIIVSGAGYWELSKGKVSTHTFPTAFPGTAVTIVIDTADKKTYCLSSEIDPSDIF